MSSWSIEAIIAFVTLLATCIPILVLLLRNFMPHRRVVQSEADVELGNKGNVHGHIAAPVKFGISKNRPR
ncbi:hypothetical protein J4E82_004007 [Alternaria postmessia]|uniref:uncharacterized protein n=1 Tax=Alternaria postmessia TaxID=1187938 RepID=UPI002224DD3B|nr:uncharacterized protein J4E82_004007 [Alternaria postmessia]KAI5377215.1 hypothetical protein J4E82_004007 [Alternaria postmessia]